MENNGTVSLLVGIVEAIKTFGYKVEGFSAYITTDVISAAGVSSSASFEMLVCSIVNYFFNEEKISYVEYAKIGQYAENVYWKKASGMMDQLACAVGGLIKMNFEKDVNYESIDFSFEKEGYSIAVINSKQNHANLSAEYSVIPNEMRLVANKLGVSMLAESSIDALLDNYKNLKNDKNISDRAILRAMHFYNENERVEEMFTAMENNDISKVIKIIQESGDSSWRYLQNCYVPGEIDNQCVATNLALSEYKNQFLHGACRVHGGGFSGVILEIVPNSGVDEYLKYMKALVGEENVYQLKLRLIGAIHVG